MLFFYGVGTYKGSPVRLSRNCSDCQGINSLWVIPVYKYAHLFWLPLFYCGKEYILKCDACGLYYQRGGITVEKNVSREMKPPIWMFAGLILFALFISYAIWDSKTAPERNKKEALEFIKTPQPGDIYEIKTDEKEFTLYKIDKIVGDSIYFLVHDFAVSKSYELSGLEKGEYAGKYTITDAYTKSELEAAIESGTIMKVRR